MELITIGQIAAALALIAGVITSISVIWKKITPTATKWLQDNLAPLNTKLEVLNKNISDVDIEACKNFLVRFLSDVEQGEKIDEVEKERFYEVYERYGQLGGNSYIHDKVERLKSKGKL